MTATVPHVTSGLGLRKFQADGFLLTRVYVLNQKVTQSNKRPSSLQQTFLTLRTVVTVLLLQTTQTFHCTTYSVHGIGVTDVSYKKNKTLKR